MTREEAFKKLEQTVGLYLMSGNADDTYCGEWREILETLKQESKTDDDCISREAAINCVAAASMCDPIITQRRIKMLPSVKPEQKTGYWYIDERPESNRETICSNCEKSILKYHKLDFDYRPKYCPNCGAKMEGNND